MYVSCHKRCFMSLAYKLTLGNSFQEYTLKEIKVHMQHNFSVSLCVLEATQMFNNRGNSFTNFGTSVNKITSCCFYNHKF